MRTKLFRRVPNRRIGIPNGTPPVTWARGDYLGLRLPNEGPKHWGVWYVALTRDDLWVCMGRDRRCYPVANMVLASVSWDPQGALRVDFIEGEPLIVMVNRAGALLDGLRQRISEHDLGLRLTAPPLLGVPDMSPVLMAEAEVEWNTAERLLAEAGRDESLRKEAARSMNRARELRHRVRVEGLRTVRNTLQYRQFGSTD
jgi:hypothetical protein